MDRPAIGTPPSVFAHPTIGICEKMPVERDMLLPQRQWNWGWNHLSFSLMFENPSSTTREKIWRILGDR